MTSKTTMTLIDGQASHESRITEFPGHLVVDVSNRPVFYKPMQASQSAIPIKQSDRVLDYGSWTYNGPLEPYTAYSFRFGREKGWLVFVDAVYSDDGAPLSGIDPKDRQYVAIIGVSFDRRTLNALEMAELTRSGAFLDPRPKWTSVVQYKAPVSPPALVPTDHFVLDLETLGTGADAVIVSIGCTQILAESGKRTNDRFRAQSKEESFYALLPIIPQFQAKRTATESTMAFWATCSEQARAEVAKAFLKTSPTLVAELDGFNSWLRARSANPVLWGNGPSFDNGLLKNLYTQAGYCDDARPWAFRNERCFRTAFHFPSKKIARIAPEIPHIAVDDAVAEAQTLCAIHATVPEGFGFFW